MELIEDLVFKIVDIMKLDTFLSRHHFNFKLPLQCEAFYVKIRFDVYETLCPQQMLVHKGGQIKNWSGEYRYIIATKLQCQAIQRALQSPNLQREIITKKVKQLFFLIFTN